MSGSAASPAPAAPRRIRGVAPAVKGAVLNAVPARITENEALQERVAQLLPENYCFEIFKTLWRIEQTHARTVGLQLPEGLLIYACRLCDILEEFSPHPVDTVILGDVTYGACCVDDFSAAALHCDLLVHYGHSCLVPVSASSVPVLYVFVTIRVDVEHFVSSVRMNFPPKSRIVLAGTIQFTPALYRASELLKDHFAALYVPQEKPLSQGEVLGCTAPSLGEGEWDACVFLADGRFHMEAIMLANPWLRTCRYDPYNKAFLVEQYDRDQLLAERGLAVVQARGAKHWGLVLGTLGRQGNPHILDRLKAALEASSERVVHVFLMSEVMPDFLGEFQAIEAWVQIGCPRLSTDWGSAYQAPLLNPFEAYACLEQAQLAQYPMDNYSAGGGTWANYFKPPSEQAEDPSSKAARKARLKEKLRLHKLRSAAAASADVSTTA